MAIIDTEINRRETFWLSKPGRLAIPPKKYEGLSPEWRSMWNEHGSSMIRADEVTIEEYRADPAKYTFAYPTCPGSLPCFVVFEMTD